MFIVFWREYSGGTWSPVMGFPTQLEANDYVVLEKWSNDKYDVPICYRGEYFVLRCALVHDELPK